MRLLFSCQQLSAFLGNFRVLQEAPEFEIITALTLEGKFPIGSFGVAGLLGPGSTDRAVETPGLSEVFRALSVVIWCKPELAGECSFQLYPTRDFKGFTFTGKFGLEGAHELDAEIIKTKIYVGGESSVKFGLPGEFFRELRGKAYAGLEAKIWIFTKEFEYVFFDVSIPTAATSAAPPPVRLLVGENQVLAAAENNTAIWQVMQRPWRDAGGEMFLPQEPVTAAANSEGAAPQTVASGLDGFVRMGQAGGSGEENLKGAVAARMIIQNNPATPVEASFPLLSNVFPDSEPALAGKGDELMLAYVRDTGAVNPVQFTEVAFSYFDGTTWTVPAPIASDVRGQFSPQVVVDGAGNAVAVYERIKDGAFAGTTLSDMAALMEIVWSRWDAVTKTWSVPQAITNNAILDFNAKLSGPLTDGDLLLTWNESASNQIDGTGVAGAATNLQVMTRRWDSATQT